MTNDDRRKAAPLPAEMMAEHDLQPSKDGLNQPTGKGFYPAHSALWHLAALGVPGQGNYWPGQAENAVRVVLIDTTVAWKHPNLAGVIDLGLMRDFSVHDEGAFVLPNADLEGDDKKSRQALATKVAALKVPDAAQKAILAECKGTGDRPPCAPMYFGAHGTAVAGLIGGRPARVTLLRPAHFSDGAPDAAWQDTVDLPYAGINPYCRIVPISTTAAPEPAMVKAALDYALLIGAQIVVVAAAWDDRDVYLADRDVWRGAEDTLADLAKSAIVLCAAGNSGDTELAYPALLATGVEDAKGDTVVPAMPGIVAVTACDAQGATLSYAPKQGDSGKVIAALSSAIASYDTAGIVDDPYAAQDPWVLAPAQDPKLGKAATPVPFPGLISLDPPGPHGYNPSAYAYTPPVPVPATATAPEIPALHLEIASLYNRFSGTSAATAVAAGLLSLFMPAPAGDAPVAPGPIQAKWTAPKGLFKPDHAKDMARAAAAVAG